MVKIRRGPAAVIGDERRSVPLLGIQLLSPVLLQQSFSSQIFWLAQYNRDKSQVDCRMGRRGQ